MQGAAFVICQHRNKLNDKPSEHGKSNNPTNGGYVCRRININALNDTWDVYCQTYRQKNYAENISQNCLLHAKRTLGYIKNDDLADHLADCLSKLAVHPNRICQEKARVHSVNQYFQQDWG